jgi:hypothetical protein
MQEFVVKQYFSKEEKPEDGLKEIEIPEEVWRALEIIARRVGGDFRMEVRLGEPGGWKFF